MILKIFLRTKAGVPKTLLKQKLRSHSLCFPQNTLTLTESCREPSCDSLMPRRTGFKESFKCSLIWIWKHSKNSLGEFSFHYFPIKRLAASLEKTLLRWPENRFPARENGRQTLVACPSSVFCVCSTRFFSRQVYAGKLFVRRNCSRSRSVE